MSTSLLSEYDADVVVHEPTLLPEGFDPARYLRSHPDVAQLGAEPVQHWIDRGRVEERLGLRPNWRFPWFEALAYLGANPDVMNLIDSGKFDSAADHWYRVGRHEVAKGEREFGADFDEEAYLDRRRDVAAAVRRGSYVSGLDHWMCWGCEEDRISGSPVVRIPRTRPATDALSEEQQAFWKENGFVILKGAISPERCDAATRRVDGLWEERHEANHPFCIDVFLDRADGRRVAMADAPDEARAHPHKINDTFMLNDVFRDIALDPEVTKVLQWVLEAPPCVVASLNFERGSTQDYHTDTLFMPGGRPGAMTAAWFALEDVSPEAGPLTYFPGSHHIPAFRFSDGTTIYNGAEFLGYLAYQHGHVDRLGLVPQTFLPKKGDVLIWHEQLFHGGSAILDWARTRKSYVCHYWNAELMPPAELMPYKGVYCQTRAFMS